MQNKPVRITTNQKKKGTKTMKTTRKLLAMVLAVIMVMSLATTAFAADITITGGASGSEYAAYKLLNATDGGDGKFAYTLNDKYDEILKEVTGKSTEAAIVAYISGLNADGIRDFADAVYAKVVAAKLAAEKVEKAAEEVSEEEPVDQEE